MTRPRTVAQIESFITMLRVACEDDQVNSRLEKLLALPDAQRRTLVENWVADMLVARAPQDFIDAIACLVDDRVAETAYAAIYRCRR